MGSVCMNVVPLVNIKRKVLLSESSLPAGQLMEVAEGCSRSVRKPHGPRFATADGHTNRPKELRKERFSGKTKVGANIIKSQFRSLLNGGTRWKSSRKNRQHA